MFNLPIPPMPVPGMGLTTPVALPVGTVVAFAGKIASSSSDQYTTNIEALGWMVCDGRACEASKYPELFAVLGYLYGGENGKFQIPDYRGQFLRGVDSRTGKDSEDPDTRTYPDPAKEEEYKNKGVGSRQKDALQAHKHKYTKVSQTPITQGDKGAASVANPPTDQLNDDPTDSLDAPPGNVRTSIEETRPKNVSVNYIIKYTNGC